MAKKIEWGAQQGQEFFDDTVGWAHGAIDVLRASGHSPYAIQFDKPSVDPRYANMRAEMWLKMADWIKQSGALPEMPELIAELTTPTFFFSKGRFQVEPKDQIKARLHRSPDLADALALTFAIPDMPAGMRMSRNNKPQAKQEYDPYARIL
jgi:hypothetical protein